LLGVVHRDHTRKGGELFTPGGIEASVDRLTEQAERLEGPATARRPRPRGSASLRRHTGSSTGMTSAASRQAPVITACQRPNQADDDAAREGRAGSALYPPSARGAVPLRYRSHQADSDTWLGSQHVRKHVSERRYPVSSGVIIETDAQLPSLVRHLKALRGLRKQRSNTSCDSKV
jgi:hypothetical protein